MRKKVKRWNDFEISENLRNRSLFGKRGNVGEQKTKKKIKIAKTMNLIKVFMSKLFESKLIPFLRKGVRGTIMRH
jgi:hypothetical protein